ncbi:TetR family transcriptional regulator [Cupriavidus sp. USMAA2-4]|uniref:TetR family transcriptional regulator n=1 Tax=Cupriavidus malaysiensis TaxID=367825 RepID=A0ABN4TD10_9BURK|nr:MULTISPECIES: TetR/AcrR family transcriptional regulator [Cupriavidus]AOY91825.1 TetR family transcriptional regulator [Cupriavidus sp. USMAA2-4]AOY98616.1 TetR family transcriptional regulator [Cupriavidus sp. USMAHM13]AOZ05047.1 TetR family transcriptional regulator [Cupriavidus malaysiensis]
MAAPPLTAPLCAGRRRPGRPSRPGPSGDAGPDQRSHLLDTATSLFAERGVAATPIRAIATAAGVTPALVHYYFRERGQLLDAVVDERLHPLVDQVFSPIDAVLADGSTAKAGDSAADLAALLCGIAERLIRAAAATPWFPGLWIREIAGVDGQLRERMLQRFALPRAGRLIVLLRSAQSRGALAPGLEPPLLIVSLIGLTLLPLATAHIWRQLPGAAALDSEALVRHVSTLLAHALAPARPWPPANA